MYQTRSEENGMYQTRSEENGLCYFDTFKSAFDHAKQDPTVWKLSWNDNTIVGHHRWRPAKIAWNEPSLKRLYQLCPSFRPTREFWVRQCFVIELPQLCSKYWNENLEHMLKLREDENTMADCILECLPEAEFLAKFSKQDQ